MTKRTLNPYQFFLRHAGYSYDPATQSPMQGRIQGARALAAAERKARDAGIQFGWAHDGQNSSERIDDNEDGGRNCNPWPTWRCFARAYDPENGDPYTISGEVLAALHGIDFGRDGEPWGDPSRRVTEAELAIEALDNLEGGA